jgi:hypothetical protein
MHWNKASRQEHLEAAATHCLNTSTAVSDAVFFDNSNGKWSIAENMIHLEKIAKRIAGALSMPKEQLANFGLATKPSRDYDEMSESYSLANQGLVIVPKAFAAAQTAEDTRTSVVEAFTKSHAFLGAAIAEFSEEDLDKYQMPHPLLGLLTVREMFYFTVFHIGHHQKAIDKVLFAHV